MEFTLITNGLILDSGQAAASRGDILIEGDTIKTVTAPGLSAPPEARVIDATDRLIIPGLINSHTHGHGSLYKGSGDRWTLELLLNAGPWISGQRSLEHKYLAASLAAAEMLTKGCTALYDLHVELPDPTVDGMLAVGQAYQDAGIRAVIAPMLADRTFFEAVPDLVAALPPELQARVAAMRMSPLESTFKICSELLQCWPFDRQQIAPALAPTIPLHCSDDFLRTSRRLADEYEVGLHMHLAESKIQVLSGLRRYGKSLTAHLDDVGVLGPDFTAAHGVWLDKDDIARLSDHGASVAHNPGSNMRLGSGIAPVREMLEAGLNVGIGTDGANCADNQNMFEALRLASFASRLRSHDYENWLSTREVARLATAGSAQALGMKGLIGSIEPGYKADIALLDLNQVNWLPLNDPINQLIHTEDATAVHTVLVAGRMVVQNRKLLTVDVARLKQQAQEAVENLAELNAETRALAEQLEQHVGHFCIGLARSTHHVHAILDPTLDTSNPN
jgi:guanine deaminase